MQRRPSVTAIIAQLKQQQQQQQQHHQSLFKSPLTAVESPLLQLQPSSARNASFSRGGSRKGSNSSCISPMAFSGNINGFGGDSVLTATQIYVQDPSSLALNQGTSYPAGRKGSGMLDAGRDIAVSVNLTLNTDVESLITRLIRQTYSDHFVDSELGGDDGVIERFGLFEAEFIDDDDENMSLLLESGSGSGSGGVGGNHHTKSRRCLRVLAMDERPLLVMNNWQFYLARIGRRSSSNRRQQQHPQDGVGGGSSGGGLNRIGLHFCVQEMSDSDRGLAFREPDSLQNFSSLVTKYRSLPEDKLEKRLAILEREESRAYEEAEERYRRQKVWIEHLQSLK